MPRSSPTGTASRRGRSRNSQQGHHLTLSQARAYRVPFAVSTRFTNPSRTKTGRISSSLRWPIFDFTESSLTPSGSPALPRAAKTASLSSTLTIGPVVPVAPFRSCEVVAVEVGLCTGALEGRVSPGGFGGVVCCGPGFTAGGGLLTVRVGLVGVWLLVEVASGFRFAPGGLYLHCGHPLQPMNRPYRPVFSCNGIPHRGQFPSGVAGGDGCRGCCAPLAFRGLPDASALCPHSH